MAIRFPSALDAVINTIDGNHVVVNNAAAVVNTESVLVANKSRSADRHDPDRRRIYMREYMRKLRASK